jgi:hypothetical protein
LIGERDEPKRIRGAGPGTNAAVNITVDVIALWVHKRTNGYYCTNKGIGYTLTPRADRGRRDMA